MYDINKPKHRYSIFIWAIVLFIGILVLNISKLTADMGIGESFAFIATSSMVTASGLFVIYGLYKLVLFARDKMKENME